MKWKLTGRYLSSIVLIVSLIVMLNGLLTIGFFVVRALYHMPVFPGEANAPETFTREFQQHLQFTDSGAAAITAEGQQLLEQQNGWIQILDENGNVLYGFQQPAKLPESYTPADIVQMYKYQEVNKDTTVYIGEASLGDRRLSYFIGIVNPYLDRYVISFDSRSFFLVLRAGLILLTVDILIALIVGYLFSKRLTQPLQKLIGGIRNLANQETYPKIEEQGVYRSVFQNMNLLSARLKESEHERKKLDLMKEEWISNISHDLKTPLSSIKGYAEMMKDPDYSFTLEELREYADIIEKKSVYITEVIEDLNLSTRLRNKEFSLVTRQVNLTSLLRNAVIDVLNDQRYADRQIEFQTDREEIIQEVDGILFQRVIFNLLYNAIVHNDEHVRITVSLESGEQTRIVISDDGQGIAEEELERIFDRYYRGTNTGADHKGSGLGMAIARDVVEAHGGQILISSEIGQGTTIVIILAESQLKKDENLS